MVLHCELIVQPFAAAGMIGTIGRLAECILSLHQVGRVVGGSPLTIHLEDRVVLAANSQKSLRRGPYCQYA
jgi:hypothetical protein